jgi:hypothetical protein
MNYSIPYKIRDWIYNSDEDEIAVAWMLANPHAAYYNKSEILKYEILKSEKNKLFCSLQIARLGRYQ